MEEMRALGQLIDKDGKLAVGHVAAMVLDLADRVNEAQSGAAAVSLARQMREDVVAHLGQMVVEDLPAAVATPADAAIDQ